MRISHAETAALIAHHECLCSDKPGRTLNALYDLREYQAEWVHASFAEQYLRTLEHRAWWLTLIWNLLVLSAGIGIGWCFGG
jgi:hypothetical protein